MSSARLPLLVEADELQRRLGEPGLVIVDMSRRETHQSLHIPGAVFLDYGQIVAARPPVMGLLPGDRQIEEALSATGIAADSHVIAYDDEGGGKAARLLWTLEAIGHPGGYSLLDGGLHVWANEGHPLTDQATPVRPTAYQVLRHNEAPLADRRWIVAHLQDPSVALLDARSPEEYSGERRYAMKGGHIPGAVNLEWTEPMDHNRNLRLRPGDEVKAELARLGVTPEKTVVAYCQTHHRSAYTWFVLHYLGFKAKGYGGSWSDWGNAPDTPVE
jgi:thiosulfate/3-mercaptopyruvate sulfurtransferase